MRATLGGRKIVGFDMELKAVFRRHGRSGQDKVALMQICYVDKEEQERVLLIMTYRLKSLPDQLEAFLLDQSITCVGANVTGDFRKIGRIFPLKRKS